MVCSGRVKTTRRETRVPFPCLMYGNKIKLPVWRGRKRVNGQTIKFIGLNNGKTGATMPIGWFVTRGCQNTFAIAGGGCIETG